MMNFAEKVALVTGAASGIGRASAIALADRGAAVMIVDRNAAGAEEVASAIVAQGGRAAATGADIADWGQCQRMVTQTVAMFGGLDIAINNAGVLAESASNFEDVSLEGWDRQIAVNLTGTFLSMRAEVPHLKARGGGAIVNTASVAGLVAAHGVPGYVASKHGVVGLTKAAALDLIAHGIRVNAVLPGLIDTPLLSHAAADPEIVRAIESTVPVGRMGRAEDVAAAILFLASDEAGYAVGSCMVLDGGTVLQ